MRHHRHDIFPLGFALLLAFAFGAGCEWKGGGSGLAASRPENLWRQEPVKMRVYPSSRLVTEDNATVLEARIELLDEMGDSTKGGGDFHFDLIGVTKGSESPKTETLYAWNVSVATLDEQRRFYDSVTRAYLFRLKLDKPVVIRRDVTLKVLLSTPDGRRISTQLAISAVE